MRTLLTLLLPAAAFCQAGFFGANVSASGPPPCSTPCIVSTAKGYVFGGTTVATSTPLDIAAGDYLYIVIGHPNSTITETVTDGAGNTCPQQSSLSGSVLGTALRVYVCASATAHAASTFTATFSSDPAGTQFIHVYRMQAITAHDQVATYDPGFTVTTATSSAFTTTAAAEVLIATMVCEGQSRTFTAGACGSGTCTMDLQSVPAGSESIVFTGIQTAQTAAMTISGSCSGPFRVDTYK